MLFLVELDRVAPAVPLTPDAGRTFVEQIVLPTIARAEQLIADKKIVSGGAVVGRIALRFILEVESPGELDRIVSSLPLWPLAQTRVTPLLALSERREHVQQLLQRGFRADLPDGRSGPAGRGA